MLEANREGRGVGQTQGGKVFWAGPQPPGACRAAVAAATRRKAMVDADPLADWLRTGDLATAPDQP